MSRTKTLIYNALGFLSLFLGLIGVFLPVMPTVPFLIVAAYCFSRGSRKMDLWMRTHPVLGPPLARWEAYRVVPLQAKIVATVSVLFSYGVFVFPSHLLDGTSKALALAVILGVLGYVWHFPSRVRLSLRIIGCGTLGLETLKHWTKLYKGSRVVGETRSEARKAEIEALGARHETRSGSERVNERFDVVVFSVPPSQFVQSAQEEVSRAWSFLRPGGRLIVVSSSGVYAEDQAGEVTEASPVKALSSAPPSGSHALLTLESVCEAFECDRVRLAGLYDRDRGPHAAYRKKAEAGERSDPYIDAHPESFLNLIHYEDAGHLIATLAGSGRAPGEVYLGADLAPLTRLEFARRLGLNPRWNLENPSRGKRLNSSWTRRYLGFGYKYPEFKDL